MVTRWRYTLPLGPEAILEAQLLMLGSQNILNPANGSPITVPSQDMVLGLYFMTKKRILQKMKSKRRRFSFLFSRRVEIVYSEGQVSLNAKVKCKTFQK